MAHSSRLPLQVNLGSHQFLFTVHVDPSEMPCLCLRHDVDALVWQPRPKQPAHMWEHVATFNALGESVTNVSGQVIAVRGNWAAVCWWRLQLFNGLQ